MSDTDLPPSARPSDGATDKNNTDDIISAIRRIMQAEEALLDGGPDGDVLSHEARKRIYAALDRLTGGDENPPTVLEALVLEGLDPLLSDWLDRHLPPLIERLVREEIRALLARSEKQISKPQTTRAET